MKKIRLGEIGLNHQNGIECTLCFAIKKNHNIWSFDLQLSLCCRILFILVALDFSVQDHVLSLNVLLSFKRQLLTATLLLYHLSLTIEFVDP